MTLESARAAMVRAKSMIKEGFEKVEHISENNGAILSMNSNRQTFLHVRRNTIALIGGSAMHVSKG